MPKNTCGLTYENADNGTGSYRAGYDNGQYVATRNLYDNSQYVETRNLGNSFNSHLTAWQMQGIVFLKIESVHDVLVALADVVSFKMPHFRDQCLKILRSSSLRW